jgi:hypothetical protein
MGSRSRYALMVGLSMSGSLAACSSDSTPAPGTSNGVDGGTGADAGGGGSSGSGRVFVTSTAVGPNLDTESGGPGTATDGAPFGDKICTTFATKANLGGTWKAWLSSSSGSALQRVGGTGIGEWTLVDKTTVVFASHAGLASAPTHAIDHDEAGNPAPPSCVWTGTDTGGGTSPSTCKSWTSISTSDSATTGDPVGTQDWTSSTAASPCNDVCRLYCFEQ